MSLALLAGCVDGPVERPPVRNGSAELTVEQRTDMCMEKLTALDSDNGVADLGPRETAGWDGYPDPCEGLTGSVPTDLHQ